MRVVLVRHAASAPDPTTPSRTWDLSDDGRRAARELRLDGVTRLLAGPEPRMAATLAHLGPVEVDERFRESEVSGWLEQDAFLDAVRRYHAGHALAGWEPAAAVVDRFTSGLVDGAAIASGGRAISAVVAALTDADGFALWRSLRVPDVVVLDQAEEGRWVASKP
jgi:broad specificity phosphatase PhoE